MQILSFSTHQYFKTCNHVFFPPYFNKDYIQSSQSKRFELHKSQVFILLNSGEKFHIQKSINQLMTSHNRWILRDDNKIAIITNLWTFNAHEIKYNIGSYIKTFRINKWRSMRRSSGRKFGWFRRNVQNKIGSNKNSNFIEFLADIYILGKPEKCHKIF